MAGVRRPPFAEIRAPQTPICETKAFEVCAAQRGRSCNHRPGLLGLWRRSDIGRHAHACAGARAPLRFKHCSRALQQASVPFLGFGEAPKSPASFSAAGGKHPGHRLAVYGTSVVSFQHSRPRYWQFTGLRRTWHPQDLLAEFRHRQSESRAGSSLVRRFPIFPCGAESALHCASIPNEPAEQRAVARDDGLETSLERRLVSSD